MTTSSLDLANSQELILIHLAELVADVRSAASELEFLLVGASARDLLLFHAYGIRTGRATEDVDLALAVADWDEFEKVRTLLLATDHFAPIPGANHKVHHRRRIEVDFIPFGGVELPDRTIAWPPDGDWVMGVLGFREALSSSTVVPLPLGQRIDVVSLPMLLVLKVLAWADRKARARGKDAPDLILILQKYLDAGQAERLYGETELLESTGKFDYESAGAWLAGRDARTMLRQFSTDPDHIEQTILSILTPQIDPDGPLDLIGELTFMDLERALLLLNAFLAGFTGGSYPAR